MHTSTTTTQAMLQSAYPELYQNYRLVSKVTETCVVVNPTQIKLLLNPKFSGFGCTLNQLNAELVLS